MNLPVFSIYYADGSRVDGGGPGDEVVTLQVSKAWLEAAADGVVAITADDPQLGRVTLQDFDFYYAFPLNHHGKGCMGEANSIGPYLRQVGLVKFGGWTDTDNYQAIKTRALAESDHVPAASAKRKPLEADSAED